MKDAQEEINLPKIIDWVLKNKNITLASLLAIFVLLVTFFYSSDEKPYFEAERVATLWRESKEEKNLESLLALIKSRPELKEKYSSLLLESYLEKKDLKSLESKIKHTSYYLKKEIPHLEAFSNISLLMEKQNYKEAHKKALSLKELLEKEEKKESTLYQFNEFHLAIICQKLGDRKGELSAYENIKTSLPLSEKEISFSDYLESKIIKLRG